MKKYVSLLTLLSLTLISILEVNAQTRPRRVGSDSGSSQTSTSTTSKPPVLGGANYPSNQRPAQPTNPVSNEPEEVDAGDVIRVNTTLVTLPVSVMDRDGRYVPNLQKEDFRVWEDGVEQRVAFFSSVDKPFSVVLMLDTSPSTAFRLEDIQDAAIAFVNQLRADDRVMVISFNNDIKVLSELTTDRYKLERAIRKSKTGDGTRLYDAVDMVINREFPKVQGRKAIVLFTDGVDTTSRRASYESNQMDAQEVDALIYPVQYDTSMDIGNNGPSYPVGPADVFGEILEGIFGGGRRSGRRGGGGYPSGGGYPPSRPSGRGRLPDDYRVGDRYLHDLAYNTGGRQYAADSLQNMSSAFANVAEELRRQYSIGYYPQRPPQAGQRRQIKVRANQPNLAVRSRESYIFNPNGSIVADGTSSPTAPVMRKLQSNSTQFK